MTKKWEISDFHGVSFKRSKSVKYLLCYSAMATTMNPEAWNIQEIGERSISILDYIEGVMMRIHFYISFIPEGNQIYKCKTRGKNPCKK